MKLSERIAAKVIVNPTTNCHLWTGTVDPDGYGQVSINGKTRQAHWAAYEDARGPVPEGLELDHICRQRNCVNPEHLEAVTHAENVRRAVVAQKKLKVLIRGQEIGVEAPVIDETEAKIMAILGIDPARADGFRLNDLAPIHLEMLRRFG